MNKFLEINLEGTQEQLSAIFSYSKEIQKSGLTTLEDYIAHAINQTLSRDHFYGAWAQDLVAAGWQAKMSYHPENSSIEVLNEMKDKWIDNIRVLEIMDDEYQAYGYKI